MSRSAQESSPLPATGDAKVASGEVLILDDDASGLKLVAQFLTNAGYRIRPTRDPFLAMQSAMAKPPDLILLDVKMPALDGFEVCRRLKHEKKTREIPIIFLSAHHAAREKVRAFEAGGVDFISKPFQEPEVLARVRTHLQLRQVQLRLEALLAQRTAAANESEERFQAIFEQAAIGLTQVSLEGHYVRVNQKFCDILGYRREELLGRRFLDITHPDDHEGDGNLFNRLLQGGTDTASREKRYIRKDQSVVWAKLTISIARHSDGSPQWFVSALDDVTLRRNLQIERDRILELNPGLIAVADLDYNLKYLNPAWERLLGHSLEELTKRPFLEFVHPEDRQPTIDEVALLGAGRQSVDFVNRYRTKDGMFRHISWTATPLPEERLMYCVGVDVTERVEAREKLEASQQRLRALASELIFAEERERLRIATDLHDGPAQSLALARLKLAEVGEVMAGSPAVDELNEASQMLRRSLQQVRDVLLDLNSPTLRQMGLAEGLQEWLAENVGKKHNLKTEFLDECTDLSIPEEMRLLLFRSACELLTNVVKHARASRVKVNICCADGMLQMTVIDDGDGFDPKSAPQNPSGNRTFGLFSIQERMTNLGGSMRIVSTPGEGCRVTLSVPLSSPTAEKDQT